MRETPAVKNARMRSQKLYPAEILVAENFTKRCNHGFVQILIIFPVFLSRLENVELLLEPGRSIIADAGVCLTTVRNRKERPIDERNAVILKASSNKTEKSRQDNGVASKDIWLLTDAGFNILLSMETYKWYYHLISASRAGENHSKNYKLAGPLCDGGDVYFDIEGHNRLPDYRLLPEAVETNEVLALLNCGAYTIAQMSQYNGRQLPAIVLIKENGTVELIRKRDGYEDLLTNDIW